MHDSTPELLHLILSSVFCDSANQFGKKFKQFFLNCIFALVSITNLIYSPGVNSETKESFLKNLRRDFPRELVPVVLAPLIYPNKPDLPMDKLNQDSSIMANTHVSVNSSTLP